MRDRRMRWVAYAAMVLGGLGCDADKQSDPHVNSNTNWLVDCVGDEECGADACLCGLCTRSCEAVDDCDGLPGATCATTADRGSCDQSTAVQRACLVQCARDDDCGQRAVCADGICVPDGRSDAGGGDGDGPGTGDGGVIAPMRDAAMGDGGSSAACRRDTDCELVPADRCCQWCGQPTARDFAAIAAGADTHDPASCAAVACLACIGEPNTAFEAGCDAGRCVVRTIAR